MRGTVVPGKRSVPDNELVANALPRRERGTNIEAGMIKNHRRACGLRVRVAGNCANSGGRQMSRIWRRGFEERANTRKQNPSRVYNRGLQHIARRMESEKAYL